MYVGETAARHWDGLNCCMGLSSHLGLLAVLTISTPAGDVRGQVAPHVSCGDQPLGCQDSWVGQAMEFVENQAAEIRRKNGPREAAGDIAEHVGAIHHVMFHLK